jgi:hypothetical protein
VWFIGLFHSPTAQCVTTASTADCQTDHSINAVEKGEGRLCSELPASRHTKPLDLESVKDVAGLKCKGCPRPVKLCRMP